MRKYLILFCCLLFALSACSSVNMKKKKKKKDMPQLSCVVVLPTLVPQASGATRTAAQQENLNTGALFIDSVLSDELDARPEFKLLSQERQNAILADPWRGRVQQVADIGAATGCGAVLQTSISRYRERIGSTMSAERPAAVAFSMELIDVTQGVVMWTTSFDESQKALFEDIFSFNKAQKRGFKWLNVQDLTRDGLKLRLHDFPYFKKEEQE